MTTDTIEKPTTATAVATTEPTQGTLKATALASFVPIESHLTTLAARYDAVAFTDLATPKGLAAAKAIRLELREQGRFAVQRLQARLKDEANDLKRIVDERSEQLIAIIKPVEDNAHSQIIAEEERRAAAKAEKERLEAEEKARLAAIEAERVADLQAGIAKIRGYVARCQEVDMTAARIAAGITHLGEQVLGEEWGDHQGKALAAQVETLQALRSLHASALAREERVRELDAQRIENERVAAELAEQRAQLAAQQAELDRQAVERAELSRQMQAEEAQRAAFAAECEKAEVRALRDALMTAELPTDVEPIAQQLAFIARRGDSPVVGLSDAELAGDVAYIPTGEATEQASDFSLPAFEGDALDPTTLAVESEAEAAVAINALEIEVDSLLTQLDLTRASLIVATDMLDELIVSHSPKRMAAGYFARVAALRDAAGIPRPTTTKEKN